MLLEVVRFSFEWDFLELLYKMGHTFDFVFYAISELGSIISAILLFTILYWCFDKKKGIKLAIIFLCSFTINNIIKILVNAKRPFEYPGKEHLRKLDPNGKLSDGATGTSFPSGHSQIISSLTTLVCLNFKKVWVKVLLIIFTILVLFSRLYLGVHFPGDVVVGALCGILICTTLSSLFKYRENKKKLFNILMILLPLPFCFLPNTSRDFLKCYGLLIGIISGEYLENRFVNFEIVTTTLTKVLRVVIGVTILLSLYFGLSEIGHLSYFQNHLTIYNIYTLIVHIFISILVFYIIPVIFTKFKFLGGKR